MEYVQEPAKRVPVADDVDVVVAGAGVSGLFAALAAARNGGEYEIVRRMGKVEIGPPTHSPSAPYLSSAFDGMIGSRVCAVGEIDSGDHEQVSILEARIREYVFDFAELYRKHIPGCRNAFLLTVSPYLHARGGPYIDGEHTVTPSDIRKGRRFEDVVYVYYLEANVNRGAKHGCDLPYRMLLPKNVDGLLVTGRSSAYLRRGHDPICTRLAMLPESQPLWR